ncbi:MAG: hypothetical protein WEB60_00235 [Terrimicrobiaceae bacterium]
MARVITIGGGGLAGLSVGLGLSANNVPVELHEAGAYPRHRVCGEFISGVSEDVLSRLGVLPCLSDALKLETMTWYRPRGRILKSRLPKPALALSRHSLDLRMKTALESAGAMIHENSRLPDVPREGFLWCGGRPATKGGAVGLKAHYEDLKLEADLEMHMGQGAYLGLCRVEGGRVNACGLFPEGSLKASRKLDLLAEAVMAAKLTSLAARLRSATQVPGSLVGVSAFRPGWQSAKSTATVGDARAIIPPFAGNGMSMAFEGALMAVEEISNYSSGKTSWEVALGRLESRTRRQFRTRLQIAMMLHPFLTHSTGQVLLSVCIRSGMVPLGTVFSLLR